MGRFAASEPANSPLKQFATRDADLACERMQDFYGAAAHVRAHERSADFALRLQVARVGALKLAKAEFTNWGLTRETGASVIITLPLSGTFCTRHGGREQICRCARQGAVARPFETYAARVDSGVDLGLTLPVAGLVARAERLANREFGESLLSRMADQFDATAPAASALARAMKYVLSEASSLDAAGFWNFAESAHEDLLANLAVACLFPELTAAREASDCGPTTIRRARDYIRERACGPVDLARLAQDLGVSMRSLQENFQRLYGHSARAYLTECRLLAARERLLDPLPGDTVTAIALESGFGDAAHFALRYRDRFGERPSATLAEAGHRIG